MNRLAAILLLVGGVLLISWAVAPAAPSPTSRDVREPEGPSGQLVQKLDADVARLRDHLDAPVVFPAPERDPFRYGRRKETAPAPVAVAPAATELPAPLLPKLLAILSDAGESGLSYRAVMAVGSDVTVVKVGDAAGPLRVRAIAVGAVELIDPVTQQMFRLILK